MGHGKEYLLGTEMTQRKISPLDIPLRATLVFDPFYYHDYLIKLLLLGAKCVFEQMFDLMFE